MSESPTAAPAPAQTSPANPAVAIAQRRPAEKLTLRQQLEGPQFLEAVKKALPRHLTAERFIRVAITAMTTTPKLAQCTQTSFFNCLLKLSQFGLEPDGRRAHLIPFENKKRGIVECQLIVDYKGLSELVYRSGVVSYLHADVVRRGDVFKFSKGELAEHVPWFLRTDEKKPAEPGEIYAVYSLARMKDGSEKAEVLAVSEVYVIRDNSQGWKAFKNGYTKSSPWDPTNPVSEQEMMKKTAFRRLSKWLPLSAEIREAVESEDDVIEVETTPARTSLAAAVESAFAVPEDDHPEQPETAAVAGATTEGAAQ